MKLKTAEKRGKHRLSKGTQKKMIVMNFFSHNSTNKITYYAPYWFGHEFIQLHPFLPSLFRSLQTLTVGKVKQDKTLANEMSELRHFTSHCVQFHANALMKYSLYSLLYETII